MVGGDELLEGDELAYDLTLTGDGVSRRVGAGQRVVGG